MAEGYYLTRQDRDLLDAKIAEVNATLRRLDNFTAGGAAGFLNTASGIAIDYSGGGQRTKKDATLTVENFSGESKKKYHVLAVKSVYGLPDLLNQGAPASGGKPLSPPDVGAGYPHAKPLLWGENPEEYINGIPTGYREGRLVALLEDVDPQKIARCVGDGYAVIKIWAAGNISWDRMRWAVVVEPSYLSGLGSSTDGAKYFVAAEDDWGSGVQVVWAETYYASDPPRLIWALVRFSAPSVGRIPVFAEYAGGAMSVARAVLEKTGDVVTLVPGEGLPNARHQDGWEFYDPGFYWAVNASGVWLVPGRQLPVGDVVSGSGPTYTVQAGVYNEAGDFEPVGEPESALNIYEDVSDINAMKPGTPDGVVLTKISVTGKVMLQRLRSGLVFWAPVMWATECGE